MEELSHASADVEQLIHILETGCQHKKKEEILFVWQENLALLGQLGKLAPGPESAAMLKQLALKKDARIKKSLSAEEDVYKRQGQLW